MQAAMMALGKVIFSPSSVTLKIMLMVVQKYCMIPISFMGMWLTEAV